jgi:hypothetical protein
MAAGGLNTMLRDAEAQAIEGGAQAVALVARLTAREHNRIFVLCHSQKSYGKMNLTTWGETNGRIKGQKRTSRQHERLQARPSGYSEAARGEHYYRPRGECKPADSGRLIADKGGDQTGRRDRRSRPWCENARGRRPDDRNRGFLAPLRPSPLREGVSL